jgi:WD40 repeat protein
MTGALKLPSDPIQAAERYINLRQCVRETFQSFLRMIHAQLLRYLEKQFESHGGCLKTGEFLKVFSKVFPRPQTEEFTREEEQKFIMQLAIVTLFEGMDCDMSGEATWIEFVEFVCAVAEELRLHAMELSGQVFEFGPSAVLAPYRPAITKCHFDKAFYWPEHPFESVIILEEGQHSFHLHRPGTLQRRKRVDGHQSDVLGAVFLPQPFEWIVTSGNDKTICFWDATFNLVKKWTLDLVIGVMCWCPEVNALYYADHFSHRVLVWHLPEPMTVRSSSGPLRPDKNLTLHTDQNECHKDTVQAMVWLHPLKTLATASLDTTIQLFDLVQHKRTHVLTGHSKGIISLLYNEKTQSLLSSGFDNYIIMWDPSAGTLSHKLSGHECSIVAMAQLPSTDYEFVSVDVEGVVKVWDVRRLKILQSFHATDLRAEKAGEIEPLDARAICPLNKDRVLISGRRMVLFDRIASDPRLTSDFPVRTIVFSHRKLEIIVPVNNDLYLWCAITGKLLTIHNNLVEGNITALCFDEHERRLFIGADSGEVKAINSDCGAAVKTFTEHASEVSQIVCMPGKVLTYSAGERVIFIHNDRDGKKAVLLKTISLTNTGNVIQIAHDGRDTIVAAAEDGDVSWYNMEFGKQVSSSSRCELSHRQAVSCCKYLEDVPLIVTADSESSLIFWTVPPLRAYEFFRKVELSLSSDDSQEATGAAAGITKMLLSSPSEDHIFVGTERGSLACVSIAAVVDAAKQQRAEIRAKMKTDAAAVISKKIFTTMPKPCDSPEYVLSLPNMWIVPKAHRGSVDEMVLCEHNPRVILTLGTDICVRLWSCETGEALGTLEQGLPEGESYMPETLWRFPVDAHEQVRHEHEAIEAATRKQSKTDDEPKVDSRSGGARDPVDFSARGASAASSQQRRPTSGGMLVSSSAPDLRLGSASHRESDNSSRAISRGLDPDAPKLVSPKIYYGAQSGSLMPAPTRDWLVGAALPGRGGLPQLPQGSPHTSSGLKKSRMTDNKKIVDAALRLSAALGAGPSPLDR